MFFFKSIVPRESFFQNLYVQIVDDMTMELDRDGKKTKPFSFDAIFGGDSTQEQVFADCKDLVTSVFDGYNVTVFAYGQTGAGKTHTMYGNAKQPGLTFRTMEALFNQKEVMEKKEWKVNFKVYFVELYCEKLVDLLNAKGAAKTDINVKMHAGSGVTVEGVNIMDCKSKADMEKHLKVR